MSVISRVDTGSGTGVPISGPTVCLGITEQQYRRFSGDTRSAWSSTGNSIGVQDIVKLVTEEVSDHLATYLCPTQVVNEVHRPLVLDKDQLGKALVRVYNILTDRKRILMDRDITVTWIDWTRADCTSITATGCAIVLDALAGKLDLSKCVSGERLPCTSYDVDVSQVRVTYWSGFETVPLQIQRAIALLARYDAKELIAGVSPMMDDLPWGAPTTQRSDLGMSRSFDAPYRYAAGSQGISVFGRGYVGIAAERLCAPFRIFEVRQI